ncbi:MAG: right-handed parallel beta-helix repeat-containing protein [Planctomycetota bacterium]|jgi:parallel beta-helix repeat protein
MTEEAKNRAAFVLAVVAVIAGPIWAVRPEEPLSSVRLLSTRGIIISTGGAGGHVGISDHPPAVAGVQKLTSENIKTACLDFVAAEADLLKVKPDQLQLANKVRADGRWYVSFRQMYNDGPVENLNTGKRYDYIQYAIYDANSGDEIVVSEGVYNENLNFHGKNLTVRSTDPEDQAVMAATVIDGGYRGPVVTFASGEEQSCLLRGFTITGGYKSDDNKGGISCIDLGRTGPTISNCVITTNTGPGIYSNNSSPTIVKCTIIGNEGDGIELRSRSYPTITNSTVAGNLRHGVLGGYPTITNCTIVGNAQSGIAHSRPAITNCIIWDNLDSETKGSAVVTYSDIKGGWPGLGNIDADPCFVDSNNGDYHLKSEGWRWDSDAEQWTWDDVTSRCIDAGNPGSSLGDEATTLAVDPLNRFGRNLRINMGAYGGTEQASMPPYGWALLADLTNDGTVDFVDLAHWTEGWLISRSGLPGDLDRNGIVNTLDFALLAQELFLETTWYE